jgi:Zn-finger nucleic acid-binding protein
VNAKLHCPKCNVSYEPDRVQPIIVGGITVGRMCPQCRGPCFEEETEPSPAAEKKSKSAPKAEQPLLHSKPRAPWVKWLIALAVLTAAVLYVFPHFYLYLRGEKNREKQKEIMLEWSKEDQKDKDLFDKYDVVMDRNTF